MTFMLLLKHQPLIRRFDMARAKHTYAHRLLVVSAIISAIAAGALRVQAQVESAKVVGTVRDSSGAVVMGADVKVTEVETNVTHTVKTNTDGEYVVTELKPGA